MRSVVNADLNWQNSFLCRMRQYEVTKNARTNRDANKHKLSFTALKIH